jgi:hypothetical protein
MVEVVVEVVVVVVGCDEGVGHEKAAVGAAQRGFEEVKRLGGPVGGGVSERVGGSCVNGLGRLGSAMTRSHSGARVLWFGDVEWKRNGVDVTERQEQALKQQERPAPPGGS